ncbi:nucleotidyltransferase [Bacillus siamensis]|uniref:nucleotidyltransferase domain-containing protein n=1 Tax=Bacillus siamensis TaxID=659243 RepID=UPI0039EB8771
MAISSATLDTWSNQGATVTPKNLREKIEKKLTGDDSKIRHKNQLEIYLQGSYRNSTNIYGNSDVDVVVQCDATFFSDVSELDTYEESLFHKSFSDSTYKWDDFKQEIVETLEDAFGEENIEIGNKSIKIDSGTYEADVVPCFEYRKYTNFGTDEADREYISGIKFYTTNESRSVVNYPKEHYKLGAKKNKRVNMLYKPTVRIFKNMKKKLIEKEMIIKEEVPSYFLENLLYNVPDVKFMVSDSSNRVYEILVWLSENKNALMNFVCQNEQVSLFGTSPEQWNETDARKFINQVINLWNGWS